jgi:hypothetical protein
VIEPAERPARWDGVMSDALQGSTGSARYRVHLLGDPEVCAAGVTHRKGDRRTLLPWSRVEHAIAAEIGEPEGVRTTVFDLVVRESGGWLAYRLDAEPGEDAISLAQDIARSLRAGCPSTSLKSLATDGIPTRRYPDLVSFEQEAIRLLEGCG